jgi:hypothetical protein
MTPFENALVAHLVGDWLLQNDWMARNKADLRHPAAWVHSGIQGVLLGCALGWVAGVVLGIVHMIVDTRVPFNWWSKLIRQSKVGPFHDHLIIWEDQVFHIVAIALWLWIAAPLLA